MCEMVIHNVEPFSTRTESSVKILEITSVKADLEQVAANITQLNAEEINQLLRLLQYFESFLMAL